MPYTVRVTDENGKIIAWIDKDGEICIEQPNHPSKLHTEENWATTIEAQSWAEQHAIELNAYEEKVKADEIAKAEAEALDKAAKEAMLANTNKLDEIHLMLTALLSK